MLLLRALLGVSLVVTAGVAARVVLTESLDTTHLVWNLTLAWAPLLLALVMYDSDRTGARATRLLVVGVVWLLFLPNAPYLVTDAKWVDDYHGGSFWYDATLVGAAAGTGLALGFVSLYLVQVVVTRRLGGVAGWTFAWAALALSGVGVYLGRFQRWNSWEVFTEPSKIVGELTSAALDPLAQGRPLTLSMIFAAAWCLGYAVFYSAFRSRLRGLVGP
jgi:uncharacterized membrane protein